VPGNCPCGLPQPYAACCGRFHAGSDVPPTAELLMRSRYSAFAVGDAEYLIRTWHPSTRPRRLQLDSARRWTGLEILELTDGSLFDTHGTVRFRASYRRGRVADVQHETSRFVRAQGQWFYVGPVSGGPVSPGC
jgi:SEC-C motif-containing protein